jgi:raffinose/stachyose/melibiose transport system permease protein
MLGTKQTPAKSFESFFVALPKHVFVWAFCIFILLPIGYIVLSSFKTNEEINRVLSFPAQPNLNNYLKVFQNPLISTGTFNSLFITCTALLISISASALAGYSIGRAKTKLFVAFYLFFLSSLMIPTVSNMASLYSLIRNLGLLNSRVGLILIYAAGAVPFGVLLYSSFIRTIPIELDEAAMLDGAGYFERFAKVIIPLLRPAIITHVVFSAGFIWNDFLMPFVFITSDDKRPLSTAVYAFQSNNVTDYGPIFSMLLLAVIPPVVFFLMAQKYFYSTVAGSIKG